MIANFSPINFTSTYKFDFKVTPKTDDIDKHWQLEEYCDENDMYYNAMFYSKDKNARNEAQEDCVKSFAIIGDDYDSAFEKFCTLNGIKFKKHTNKELLNPLGIIHRTVLAPNSSSEYKIILINSKKLENLAKNQKGGNFDYCQKIYEKYYTEATENLIKSCEPIIAPTFSITSSCGNMLEFIEKYGIENVVDNSISLDFIQKTDQPDHCLYFALKNSGMNLIPVAVDENTQKLASALGLIK